MTVRRGDAAGEADDEGDLEGGVVGAVLFEAAVLAEAVAVVGHIDDEGVVFQVEVVKFGEDLADVVVEEVDGGVVGGDDALLFGGGEVAEDERNLGVVLGSDGRDGEIGGMEFGRAIRAGSRRGSGAPGS